MDFTEQKTKLYWSDIIFGPGGLVLLLSLLLYIAGVIFIYLATPNADYYKKQLIWGVISLITIIIILHIDYIWIVRNWFILYAGGIFLLILTRFVGQVINNARRWIKLGPVSLQTSDIMKVAFIIALAYILTTQPRKNSWQDLVRPAILASFPMLLIVMQPDLGTTLVFIPISICMILASGLPMKIFVVLGVIALNLGILVWFYGLHDYQKQRILVFVNQSELSIADRQGDGYHLFQSKTAIGNGGLFGTGYSNSIQNRYKYLPENHTDFIFAAIGEYAGFIGIAGILILYFLLYFLMMFGIYSISTPCGQLIIVGIMTLLAFQTVVNTCMTMGLAPITGLPLPFLSYGGTSLLTNSICIGLVVSILGRRSIR